MKTIRLLGLILAAIVLLAACSPKADDLTVQAGKLRVGMDLQYPPFETFDSAGNPSGISVDIAWALADSLGLELEVVNMDFSTLVPALETRAIDIVIASMSITQERMLKVDFSKPYVYFKLIGLMNPLFAQEHQLDDASTAQDLWSITQTRFIGLAGQISSDIPEQHGFEVKTSVDKSAAITEIINNRADFLLISPEVVVAAHQANPGQTAVFWTPLDVSPIGMAVVKGNQELLDKANAFIDQMDEPGGLYDRLRSDYQQTINALYGPDMTMDFYFYE